jgi:hypothetical protein
MIVYAENDPMIRRLWRRIERRLPRYPGALGELGSEFLDSLAENRAGYFSGDRAAPLVHLPLWLGKGLPGKALLDVLEPTALAYFYVRIQDDVLDEPGSRGKPAWLLLGNALLWDALEGLRRCSAEPRFWRLAGAAWNRFSDATAAERGALFAGQRRYADAAFRAHARKVALAEIPLYAVLALRGDWSGTRHVERLVHLLGCAYGLANDIQGLDPDAAAGHHTYVLSRLDLEVPARTAAGRPHERALQTDLLERVLAQAIDLHEQARPVAHALGLDRFDDYTDERIAWLRRWSDEISLARLARAVEHRHVRPKGGGRVRNRASRAFATRRITRQRST